MLTSRSAIWPGTSQRAPSPGCADRPGGQSPRHQPQLLGGDLLSTYQTPTANGPSARTGEPSDSTTQQAKDKAQQAAGQARRGVRDQVDTRSTQAGERVSGMAGDMRGVSEHLRGQGKEQPAKLAEQAAQRAESLGDYLQRSDGDTILRDIEDFGRRQPMAVIAGGIAIGFAASRFLKASSERRSQSAPRTSRGLTSGAPTSRTGLGAQDVGNGTHAPGLVTPPVREEYGGAVLARDNPGAA